MVTAGPAAGGPSSRQRANGVPIGLLLFFLAGIVLLVVFVIVAAIAITQPAPTFPWNDTRVFGDR